MKFDLDQFFNFMILIISFSSGTGIHRYTFLVFDEGISPKDYTSVEPVDLVQIQKRVNWNFVQPGSQWMLYSKINKS